MKSNVCHVICAGERTDFLPFINVGDFIIASDGGMDYLNQVNIVAELAVGDFDSVNGICNAKQTLQLKREKDETDTFVCAIEAIKLGFNRIYIHCGVGGRVDHTIANIQLLTFLAKKGCYGFLFDHSSVITCLPEGQGIAFDFGASGDISVFSASDQCEGVNIKGLKYALENGLLKNDFALGVSNQFVGSQSEIYAKSGFLTVVFPITALKYIKY